MSNSLPGHDDPIRRLLDDGYDLVIDSGHLVVRQIPYISPQGGQTDGTLALPIKEDGGAFADAIGNHTILFIGLEPLDEHGTALGTVMERDIGHGTRPMYQLSFKPPSGSYAGLYEKVRSYARIVSGPARSLDPSVTPTPGAAFQLVEDGLPFAYRDTNTTRAGLTSLNKVFRGHTVAIVGMGGTGSYILDQVAKTWVDRIVLIDGDVFENHNAFRAPGAASLPTLQAKKNKAEYFAEEYSRMHTGITFHPTYLSGDNMHLLDESTFVFLAAADANERPEIMRWLSERKVPFIDAGIGVSQAPAGLTGLVKLTMHSPGTILPESATKSEGVSDDYGTNIQVADLNALNAVLAVIRWKRHLGYYASEAFSDEVVFKLYTNEIRNGVSE